MPFKLTRRITNFKELDAIVLLNLEDNQKITHFENKILSTFPSLKNHVKSHDFKLGNIVVDNEASIKHTFLMMKYPQTSSYEPQVVSMYKRILGKLAELEVEEVAIPFFPNSILTPERSNILFQVQDTIIRFLLDHEMMIHLVLDDRHHMNLTEQIAPGLNLRLEHCHMRNHVMMDRMLHKSASFNNNNILDDIDEGFQETLFKLIDASGMTDVEVYKKANIDRRLFSKIRSDKHYHPSKKTALALAIALELDLRGVLDLIGRAGYTLAEAIPFDVAVKWCLKRKIQSIYHINDILFEHELDTF